jgi:hypothetical protein
MWYYEADLNVGVTNTGITGLLPGEAGLNGTLYATQSVFDVWVYWSTNNGVESKAAWLAQGDSYYMGSFTNVGSTSLVHSITGLPSATTYYYNYYASNVVDEMWGDSYMFGSAGPPTVENTGGATGIGVGTATLQGVLTGGGLAEIYVCWGTSSAGTNDTADWDHVEPLGTNFAGIGFSTNITGAHYGITYYYRCYATNSLGEDWADSATNFSTLNPVDLSLFTEDGLVIWLDAGAVDTNDTTDEVRLSGPDVFLKRWDDQTANGNHASRSSAGDQPKYIDNALNGHPVIRFTQDNDNDGDDMEFGNLSAQFPSGASWFAAVTLNEAANKRYNIFGGNSNNDDRFVAQNWSEVRPSTFLSYRANMGGTVYNNFPSTGSVIFSQESDASVYRIVLDGTTLGTSTPGFYSGAGTWQIGNRVGSGQAYNGDIAEMLFFDRVLSSEEADDVGGYLEWKYGLSTAYTDWSPPADTTIVNEAVSDLAPGLAQLNATLAGAGAVYDVSVYWSTNNGGTNVSTWLANGSNAFIGSFTNVVTSLSHVASNLPQATTYYYAFRGTNEVNEVWGVPSMEFVTIGAPTVNNDAGATNEGIGTATLQGELTAGGQADIYVCWGTSLGGENTSAWDNVEALGSQLALQAFSTNVTEAYYGITYYYRCYATNVFGEDWADSATNFMTLVPEGGAADLPVTNNLVVWFDAGIEVSTNAGGVVQTWNDQSGNGHHATLANGAPLLVSSVSEINDRPAIETRGNDDWLNLSGNLFARENYIVFRSPNATFSNYGGILGQSSGRPSNYLVENNNTTFHGNQYPDGVSRNGTALTSAFSLAPIDEYMVVKIIVNTGDTAQQAYQIGRADAWTFDMDVAEIIGYSTTLSAGDEDMIGGYLADKYGITTSYTYIPTAPADLSITNQPATTVLAYTAELNAGLSGTGAVFDVYAYWGETNELTNASSWASNAFVGRYTNLVGNVSYTAGGMQQSTTNYFTFLATNELEEIWATNVLSFLTAEAPHQPVVTNTGATAAIGSATLNGELLDGSTANIYVYWGTTDGSNNAAAWANTNILNELPEDPFSTQTDTNLTYGITYYYRSYASNIAGTAWASNTISFTTADPGGSAGNRLQILFDYSGSTLTNFPALVRLNESISNFTYSTFLTTNGYDLRFWNADEDTELNYEIEEWAPMTNGVSNVTDISGCVLWLKADTGVQTGGGGAVTNWVDQSGQGNDASQGTGSAQPALVNNILGGMPALDFDGGDVLNMPDGTVPTGNSSYSVFAVVRADSMGAYGYLGSGNYGSGSQVSAFRFDGGSYVNHYWWSNDLATPGNSVKAGNWYLIAHTYDNTVGRVAYINGLWMSSNANTSHNNGSANNTIGKSYNTEYWRGEIAEIIIYSEALTSVDLDRVGAYLEQKYGLNTAYPGTSHVWVQVPEFTSGGHIWATWGNAGAADQEAYTTNGSVWSEDFFGIWHLNDANGSGNFPDSSTNEYTGANSASDNAAGVIADAQSFDGGNDYISYGTILPAMTAGNTLTWSFWAFQDTTINNSVAFGNRYGGTGWIKFTPQQFEFSTGTAYNYADIPNGEWMHHAVTKDGTSYNYYRNGALVAPWSNSGTMAAPPLFMGGDTSNENWDGTIDEGRLSSVPRSADWIMASYSNQVPGSTFATFGEVEEGSATLLNGTPTLGSTDTVIRATLNASNATYGVTAYWGPTDGTNNVLSWSNSVFVGSYTDLASNLSATATGLVSGAQYYFTFQATNAATNVWAEPSVGFVTLGPPLVENAAPTAYIGYGVMRGNIISTNGAATTARIYYGLTDGTNNPSAWDTNVLVGAVGVEAFSRETSHDLQFNTKYYYRCYAENAYGPAWASSSTNFTPHGPVFVDIDAAGLDNGSSWTNAYNSFADGLTAVSAVSNVIWVAEGTYDVGGSTFNVTQDGTEVYGGFDASETAVTQRDWTNNIVLLDGENNRRVIEIKAHNVLLDGVTITNGYHNGNGQHGIGLLMDDGVGTASDFTMANCRVIDNQSNNNDERGAGAYFYDAGDVLISNCVFSANIGDRTYGIGLYSWDVNLTIVNSEISGNTDIEPHEYRHGHGFYFRGSSYRLDVIGTEIVDNGEDNDSNRNDFHGGAGYIYDGTASFRNCLIARNVAVHDGGGIYLNSGTLTLESCTLAGNKTADSQNCDGGAVYVNSGTLNITNCILWGNMQGSGYDASSEFVANDIHNQSGSVYIDYSSLSGTNAPNIVGTVNLQAGIITGDPLFASDFTDLHLKSTYGRWNGTSWVTDFGQHSPAIDLGDPASDYANEPVNADGGRINLGAYGNTAEASKSLKAKAPTVVTRTAQVAGDAVLLRGELLNNSSMSQVTFYYGLSNGGSTPSAWDATNVVSQPYASGSIFGDAVALDTNTTYYFTVYATNSLGEDWADTQDSFTTGDTPPGGGANVIHVDKDAVGIENGSSWTNAYKTFTEGLAAAGGAATTIWIADGTYSNDSTYAIYTDGLEIYGSFAGTETNVNDRDLSANETVLDGQGTHRVIDINAGDTVLDGLTITNGYTDADNYAGGAGIRMANASPDNITLANCSVVDNYNNDWDGRGGGGYFESAGTILISNCVFGSNRGYRMDGNGFYVLNSHLTIVGSVISNNTDTLITTEYQHIRRGHGFYFQGNGYKLNVSDSMIVDNGEFEDRHSWGDSGGGGVFIYGNASTVAAFTNCVIARNASTEDGGGIYNYNASLTLENCTLADNQSGDSNSGEGGGLYNRTASATIINCIFYKNRQGDGDNNSLFVDNDITVNGGSVSISYSSMSAPHGFPYIEELGGGTVSYNAGVITGNPLFAANYSDLHLQSTYGRWNGAAWVTDGVDSPAIDAGSTLSDFSNEPAGENGGQINMGAYGNTAEASKSLTAAPFVETRSGQPFGDAAYLRGELLTGSASVVTFYYGTSSQGQSHSGWDGTNVMIAAQTVGGVFQELVTGLETNTTYWYNVYATNVLGDNWGVPTNFLTGATPAGGGANIVHVDADAPGVENGSSWLNAYTTFEDGLAAAGGATNTIWIAEGTYIDGFTFDVTSDGLEVYGGFAGTETNVTERDWEANEVLLDGAAGHRVMDILADNVILDGVTITNGYSASGNQPAAGLRMNNTGTGFTMANCHVVDNFLNDQDDDGAGAYFNNAGNVLLSNCVFNANRGRRCEGIGFYSVNTHMTLVDCEISGNADDNDSRHGQGFYFNGSSYTLNVINCRIVDNGPGSNPTDGQHGGGVFINNGTATFVNSVIARNEGVDDGGGIYHNSGNLTLENCTLAANTTDTSASSASHDGGGLCANNGTITITNCIFWGNLHGSSSGPVTNDILRRNSATVNIYYSSFSGSGTPYIEGTVNLVTGNIAGDALLASDFDDLHLRSAYGRWTPSGLTYDFLTSPAIDAGGAGDYSNEPAPNGSVINMGAYGNTLQASLSFQTMAPIINNDAGAVTDIGIATLQGQVVTTGGLATVVYTFWGESDETTNLTWDTTITNTVFDGSGNFSSVLTNVYYGVDYYYRVMASNSLGVVWATNTVPFQTIVFVATVYDDNALDMYGYHINNDNITMDLDNNGGMMGNGDPTTGPSYYGQAVLTSGPGSRGLDFNNDGDFTTTGAIGQNDNYSDMFLGYFQAPETGSFQFQRTAQDDRTGMWLDRDRDDVFESSTPGLGSNRDEQLAWNDGGVKTLTLTNGLKYLVAFTHREGGGGSQCEFRFKSPSMGALTVIKPSDAAQDGLWSRLLTAGYSYQIGVTNVYMSNVLETSAQYNGDYSGTASVMNVWHYWGLTNAGTVATNWANTNFFGTLTNVTATLSTNIPGLSPDTPYHGIFLAQTPNLVTSIWSDVVSFETAFPAGKSPSNLVAAAETGSIGLSWTENFSNETGFVIERSPTNNSNFTLLHVTGPNATNYVDGIGDAGVTYYYRVAATNSHDLSDYSNETNAVMPAGIADIYVTTNGVHASGPSWAQPTSMDNALSIATTSNVIWVAEGTYSHSSTFEVTDDNVQIYGSFEVGDVSAEDRDFDANPTLLDGEGARRVIEIKAHNVVLDGLTITNGYHNGNGQHGVGLLMDDGTGTATNLTMANCRVVANVSDNDDERGAGAYFINAGSVLLTNCVFEANRGRRTYGIGFYSDNVNMTLIDCVIRDQWDMTPSEYRHGHGFYFQGNGYHLEVRNSEIVDNGVDSIENRNDFHGGGGYLNGNASTTARFVNSVIAGNRAVHDGGGLYLNNGNLTLENCTLADNRTATSQNCDGGALFVNNGTVTITNCIFWGNMQGESYDASSHHVNNDIHRQNGTVNIDYTALSGTTSPNLVGTINLGTGILTGDPLFASDYDDVHLQSRMGRWNGTSWVTDAIYSPYIDAGDPAADYSNEPAGQNGLRLNLGAYGNTSEASKSTNAAPIVETRTAVVAGDSVQLRGIMTTGSMADVTFYYGTNDGFQVASNWDATNVMSARQGEGYIFGEVVAGLQTNQTYYFTVYSTNDFGEDWADASDTFTTGDTPPGGGAGVIHVDKDAVGLEDGTSWTNAYTTFEEGLDAAGALTTIWIAEGTYTNDSTFFISVDGLEIYGGFAGTETNVTDRDWDANEVLLDGQGARRVIDINAGDVVLDGLTITNGYLDANLFEGGAGIRMPSGSPNNLTLANCRVVDNYNHDWDGAGGGAFIDGAGNVLVSNSVFDANRGYRMEGNGFYCRNTHLTILDSVISSNTDTLLTTENQHIRRGHGFYFQGNGYVLDVRNTDIIDNGVFEDRHNWGDSGGGGVYITGNASTMASFLNCLIARNASTEDGGGIYNYNATLTLENCTLADNQTGDSNSGEGGALYNRTASATIKNCVFWKNRQGDGDNNSLFVTNDIAVNGGAVNISYSSMTGTNGFPYIEELGGGAVTYVSDNIIGDPLFAAEFTDMHLKSTTGRWDGASWVIDVVDSPAIDGGDPASDYSNEPADGHGGQINMGVYGNTAEASKSLTEAPQVETRSGQPFGDVARLRGELMAGSASTITFYYGTSDEGQSHTAWEATNVMSSPQSVGAIFEQVVSGLDTNQTYWYIVYATNVVGEDWGTPTNFLTGATPAGGGASIIHVDGDAAGVENGSSWLNAYTTFEDGLAAAGGGTNTIWIAKGTYSYGLTFDITSSGIEIYGGFDGSETNVTQRDWDAHEVLLDGQGTRRVIDIQTDNVILDGLVITNGYIPDSANQWQGGAGVRQDGPDNLTMANCRVVGNVSDDYDRAGAGAFFRNAVSILVSNCVFDANTARRHYGIGLYSENVNLTIVDSVISGNKDSNNDDWRDGQGLHFRGSAYTLDVRDSQIVDNGEEKDAYGQGGGMYLYDGTAIFRNCIIARNRTGERGAGIYHRAGNLTLENCTLADNRTGDSNNSDGGGLYNNGGNTYITNSIFWANMRGLTSNSYETNDIHRQGGNVYVYYSSMSGANTTPYIQGTVTYGVGTVTGDAHFGSEFDDLHLKSPYGRWTSGGYVFDATNSAALDGGSTADYSNEPSPNGNRINMGAYGNTAEAALSPADVSITTAAGVTNLGTTNVWLMGDLVYTSSSPTYVWFYYGTNDGAQLKGNWETNVYMGSLNLGLFSNKVEGLGIDTDYWYTTYGSNTLGDEGWAFSSESFTTYGNVEVDNNAPVLTKLSEAEISGTLVAGGTCDTKIYWGATDGGTTASAWDSTTNFPGVAQGEAFSVNVTGLYYGVRYFYRSWASNDLGGAWASSSTNFTTLKQATVAPMTVTNGMTLWLAADDVDGDGNPDNNPAHAQNMNLWPIPDTWVDKSGSGNDADIRVSDPQYWTSGGPNGQPVVKFDNDDRLSTTFNFEPTHHNYTIFSVARYNGGGENEVVIGSRDHDWRFGFDGQRDERWYTPGNWIHQGGSSLNYDWHIHAGHHNDLPDPEAWFWKDGNLITSADTSGHNTDYEPRRLQLNGNRDNQLVGHSEIAEVIMYNRVLSDEELEIVGAYLEVKYGLTTAYEPEELDPMSITNQPATDVLINTATLHADLVVPTGAVLEVWAYWGLSNEGTTTNYDESAYLGSYTGTAVTIDHPVAGLQGASTYFFTFRATNAVEDLWGAPPLYSFSTGGAGDPPAITNLYATNITYNAATVVGNLTSTGGIPTTVSVYWGTTDGLGVETAWENTNFIAGNQVTGVISNDLAGLIGFTDYYYRFRASNVILNAWATPTATFKTEAGTEPGAIFMLR